MILGYLALVTAAFFASAAFYVNFAEQPARLALDDNAALMQWQRSYQRAAPMQASLVMLGSVLGLAAWWWEGGELRWLVGAVVLLAPWPYTLLVIKPVNDWLNAIAIAEAGAQSRALIVLWGALHAGRTALRMLVTAIFLWVVLARQGRHCAIVWRSRADCPRLAQAVAPTAVPPMAAARPARVAE